MWGVCLDSNVIQAGIAEDATIDTAVQRVQNLRCYTEFHICYPHANELVVLIGKYFFRTRVENIAAKPIGIQCVGMTAVDDLVKVVSHDRSSFLYASDGL